MNRTSNKQVSASRSKPAAYQVLVNPLIFPMRAARGLIFGIMVGTASVEAQNVTGQTTQTTLPPPTPYAITVQDGNSRVWQSMDYAISPDGEVITNTHSYTELASGLNHLVNGQWVASSEQIDILPNGTAVATNGQHQAYFPGDIYQGQIELVTPDGLQLNSRPLGLSYFDGTNTVLIAQLTNSVGLVSGVNQVIYTNAFTGFKVDLRYTYTKAGFEQDIILRQQPPTPESLGLNPDTARLQVMTEFFSPPQPTIDSEPMPVQAGLSLTDDTLDFGTMQMGPGKAFLLGQNAQDAGALVSKHWVQVNGRQFLIEEVPVDAILECLAALPLTAMNSGKHSHTASKHLKLPPQRLAQNTSKAKLIATVDLPKQGFVLDYQILNSTVSSYTFQGDTTYYISAAVSSGTTTFEGGAVLKYAAGASLTVNGSSSQLWKADAYRPIIFTAQDDNSVGETLTNSTGAPTNNYANPALNFNATRGTIPVFSNFRIAYAGVGISVTMSGLVNPTIKNGQFVNCQYAAQIGGFHVYNTLFANIGTNFTGNAPLDMQNVTVANVVRMVTPTTLIPSGYRTENCIYANIGTYGATPAGTNNGFYNCPSTFGTAPITTGSYPFQTVGAGNYYLANNCTFRNAGITNVDAVALTNIQTRTTYPPILYSNVTVAVNTTLSPQAQRDTDTPDLGFHYDPIDYLVDQFTITNATLTLTNGVAIASDNDAGIVLADGSSIVSVGNPLYPDWLVRYSSVQEQPVSLLGMSGTSPASGFDIEPNYASVAPSGQFRFTKFACPAGGGDHIYHSQSSSSYGNLLVQDCECWSGANILGGNTNTVATLKNNLFWRSTFNGLTTTSNSLSLSNNLFWGISTAITVQQPSGCMWYAFNNDFDTCLISATAGNATCTNGYNAYINSTNRLNPNSLSDIVTNTVTYQTGPLGTFYQPSSSPLINMGSTNANLLGFYHYTVITNMVSGLEIKETNSIVDIGYHYVAVDTNGIPIDTNGDGGPDYLEDANGNGLVDSGEIGWNIVGDLGLQVIITRPRSGSDLP
jgi:archaellum component FlaF (FlaF/FlaG flagellin family)